MQGCLEHFHLYLVAAGMHIAIHLQQAELRVPDGDLLTFEVPHIFAFENAAVKGPDGNSGTQYFGILPDDDDIEKTVLEIGGGGDAEVVAELLSIGDGQDKGFLIQVLTVDLDLPFPFLISPQMLGHDPAVHRHAPAFALGKFAGYQRIEAYTGVADKDAAVGHTQVYCVLMSFIDQLDGLYRIERDAEAARQTVARAFGDDRQCGIGAVNARNDIIDGTVAANRYNCFEPLPGRFLGQRCAVLRILRIGNVRRKLCMVQVLLNKPLQRFNPVYPRFGIDDE